MAAEQTQGEDEGKDLNFPLYLDWTGEKQKQQNILQNKQS